MAKVGSDAHSRTASLQKRVENMVETIDRRAVTFILLLLLPLIAPVAALFMFLDWRLAVLLTAAWLVLSELGMRRIGAAVARRAVLRFNHEFPKGSTSRQEALQILAGLQCRHAATVLKKVKAALGIPLDAFISTRQLPPESAAAPEVMASPEYLPLDVDQKPVDQMAPASGVILPIEPTGKERRP